MRFPTLSAIPNRIAIALSAILLSNTAVHWKKHNKAAFWIEDTKYSLLRNIPKCIFKFSPYEENSSAVHLHAVQKIDRKIKNGIFWNSRMENSREEKEVGAKQSLSSKQGKLIYFIALFLLSKIY